MISIWINALTINLFYLSVMHDMFGFDEGLLAEALAICIKEQFTKYIKKVSWGLLDSNRIN